MKRFNTAVLLSTAAILQLAFLTGGTNTLAAGAAGGLLPTAPIEFPGGNQQDFYTVLEQRVAEYGIGTPQMYGARLSEGEGVDWAKMFDISGNGDPEFAITYSWWNPDTGETERKLEIYDNYSAGPWIVFEETIPYWSGLSIEEKNGSPCLKLFGTGGELQLLTMQNGSIINIAEEADSRSMDMSGRDLTGYLDANGNYQCIRTDLADTYRELTGCSIGTANSANHSMKDLYIGYVEELTGHDYLGFELWDIDRDGTEELVAFPLTDTASSETMLVGVVTMDTDCIRILETGGMNVGVADEKLCIAHHVIGVSEVQDIYVIVNHRFQLVTSMVMYAPGGFGTGDMHYMVNDVEVSEEEYEAAMDTASSQDFFFRWDDASSGYSMNRNEILAYLYEDDSLAWMKLYDETEWDG